MKRHQNNTQAKLFFTMTRCIMSRSLTPECTSAAGPKRRTVAYSAVTGKRRRVVNAALTSESKIVSESF